MDHQGSRPAGMSAGAIVVAYVISAVLWIALSDRVLGALVRDPGELVTISTLKGWAFVALTGAMLAAMLRRNDTQRSHQASELEARESRFRLLAEHAQDLISRYRVLPTPAFEYVSPSVEAMLGYPPGAFYADPSLMARLVHPDDRHLLEPDPVGPQVAEAAVMRFLHADGHCVWLEQRSTPILDPVGRLVAVEGVARDVSDRQRTDAHLARLNRVHRTLSAANEGLVRAETESALLETICRVVVEQGGFRFAWVGYREEDAEGTVRPMAHAGYEAGYLASITVSWHDIEHGRGPAGVAIRSGRPVISSDLAADPAMAPWYTEALARGYASVAVLPLSRDGDVFGVLAIYSDERDAFGDEEIELLAQLAVDLAYGVGTLRAGAAQRALEAREVGRARERALIADALEGLRPLDTAEQTAEAICRRVVELPEIAMASLLLLEPDGSALPLALIVDDGRVLERKNLGPERSAQLRTRAGQGPWVEAWRPRPGHPYLADHLAIGLRAQAYAPVRSGATLIGLLTVGSREPDAVALLTERLPAILEFASLAGALLAPSVALTSATAATRGSIQAIIDARAFHPVFQPIVELHTGAVVGYEALTRFDDGTGPDLVFASAARVGLEVELEVATLEAALGAAAVLPPEAYLSLNASPALIGSGRLGPLLAGVDRRITLEITEHAVVADYAVLRREVAALGPTVHLAVDDAGAGYASLRHILELAPNFVKLDLGLIRGIDTDPARQALIAGMSYFAVKRNVRLVAEGIETAAELETLRSLGIPYGQGYLFGRPQDGRGPGPWPTKIALGHG